MRSKQRLIATAVLRACALLGIAASMAAAQQPIAEPREFRGVTWMSAFAAQGESMTLIRREGDVAYYRKNGERLSFGQADAIKIAYRYYKERFSAGVVQTYGMDNKKALLASLLAQHGEPQRPRKHIEQYIWQGSDASVILTCEITSYCAAEFFSMPLREQEVQETGNATTFDRDSDD